MALQSVELAQFFVFGASIQDIFVAKKMRQSNQNAPNQALETFQNHPLPLRDERTAKSQAILAKFRQQSV